MFKRIGHEAVAAALGKAEHYRLLNEPAQAESICRDVLAVEPENQRALVTLLLALSDQFGAGPGETFREAQAAVGRLNGDYERLYYAGLLWERRGHARAVGGGPGSAAAAYDWVRRAMGFYEEAERVRPAGNDDALLRWNSCVRLCERYGLRPPPADDADPVVGDD